MAAAESVAPPLARRCYDPPSLMLPAFRPLSWITLATLGFAAAAVGAGCVSATAGNVTSNALRVGGSLDPIDGENVEGLGRRDPRSVLTDLVVDTAECVAASSTQVTRDDALADFDVVARILERGYAGFDVLERRGQDWSAVFLAARLELQGGPERWASERWVDWLAQTFESTGDEYLSFWSVGARRDNHHASAAPAKRGYAPDLRLIASREGWTVIDPASHGLSGGAVLIGCEVAEGHSVTLQPTLVGSPPRAVWMPVVFDDESPTEIECAFHSGERAIFQQKMSVHPLRTASVGRIGERTGDRRGELAFVRRDDSPAWLELRGSGGRHDGSLEEFVATARELRGEQVVVLDLRGNVGGDDAFVRRWFRDFTAGDLGSVETDALQSEVTLQGAINSAECRLQAQDDPASVAAERHELARLRSELGRAREPFRSVYESDAKEQGSAPREFAGRLIVITDSRCASSCETAVALARKLPGALIVGENTAGAGEFGQAERYRLPNTGVWMQAPTKWFRGELVPLGGRGFKPDFWLDSPDPDVTVTRLTRCLAERRCVEKLREGVTMGAAAKAATQRTVVAPEPVRAVTTDA